MKYVFSNEEWRLKRLQKAVRIACAILGLTEAQLSALVSVIEDERGTLSVSWLHSRTKQQEMAFETAWHECGESGVKHGGQA